jgi:hypothetical protein
VGAGGAGGRPYGARSGAYPQFGELQSSYPDPSYLHCDDDLVQRPSTGHRQEETSVDTNGEYLEAREGDMESRG